MYTCIHASMTMLLGCPRPVMMALGCCAETRSVCQVPLTLRRRRSRQAEDFSEFVLVLGFILIQYSSKKPVHSEIPQCLCYHLRNPTRCLGLCKGRYMFGCKNEHTWILASPSSPSSPHLAINKGMHRISSRGRNPRSEINCVHVSFCDSSYICYIFTCLHYMQVFWSNVSKICR